VNERSGVCLQSALFMAFYNKRYVKSCKWSLFICQFAAFFFHKSLLLLFALCLLIEVKDLFAIWGSMLSMVCILTLYLLNLVSFVNHILMNLLSLSQCCSPPGQALAPRCLEAKFLWPWPWSLHLWPWPWRSRPWPCPWPWDLHWKFLTSLLIT